MSQRTDYDSNEDADIEDFDDDLDEDIDDEFDATSRRFSALRTGGRRVLGEVAEHGKQRITEAADRGKGRLADRLEDSAEYLRNDLDVLQDDFVRAVQRNPLGTAAIAIGVGFVLGRTLKAPSFGRRGRKKDSIGSQLSKTLMSTAAAILAARLKNIVIVDDDDGYEEPEPPRKRPRKQGRPSRE